MNFGEQNRLKWKCRRGRLELDLVFERFLDKNAPIEAKSAACLNELLDFPDNELWDIVSGRSDRYGPQLNDIVARLRAA